MKPLLIIVIVLVSVLAPISAHADDEPRNPGTATYDEYLPGVLNCDAGVWDFWTVHYAADPVEYVDGAWMYTDWYEVGRSNAPGGATGSPDGDCPNWGIVEVEAGPVWVNSAPPKPAEPAADPIVQAVVPLTKTGLVFAAQKVGLA
jgi:hypothetical protein